MDRAGLPVTTPARTAADLLGDREDPGAVGQVVADALRTEMERPARVAEAVAPYAHRYGLTHADGPGLLGWLLEQTGETGRQSWLDEARGAPTESG